MAHLKFSSEKLFAISVCVLFIFFASPVRADETPAQRAEKSFVSARTRFHNEEDNLEAAWQLGRAAFDWAEYAGDDDDQREAIALTGIEASHRVLERDPNAVQGHYYLAMNLGQLARTKSIGALKLVREMEKEFSIASDLDENFDFAGPDRNLGWLYFQAPGWPTSIGSHGKARRHLERAVKLKPNYPENHLNLIEAYLKWNDKREAQRAFKALKELWPAAKKEFAGPQWKSNWADWEKRLERIEMRFPSETSHREN